MVLLYGDGFGAGTLGGGNCGWCMTVVWCGLVVVWCGGGRTACGVVVAVVVL